MDYYSVLLQGSTQVSSDERNFFFELLDPLPQHWLLSLAYSTTLKDIDYPPPEHQIFWDCGAWGYRNEESPVIDGKPLTPERAFDFYLEYSREGSIVAIPDMMVTPDDDATTERRKMDLTMQYADEFLELSHSFNFKPIAVVHGNSFKHRTEMLDAYLKMGYEFIAHGGVAVHRTEKDKFLTRIIQDTYERKHQQDFHLHIFGVTGIRYVKWFQHMGVDSVDGSGWMTGGMKGNYYYHSAKTGRFQTFNVNQKVNVPQCSCKTCVTIKDMPCPGKKCNGEHILDPLAFGCGPNNTVRCTHNLNNYMSAFNEVLRPREGISTWM